MMRKDAPRPKLRLRLKYRSVLMLTATAMSLLFLFVITVQFSVTVSSYLGNIRSSRAEATVNQASELLSLQLSRLQSAAGKLLAESAVDELICRYPSEPRASLVALNQQLAKLQYALQTTNEQVAGVALVMDKKLVTSGSPRQLYGMTPDMIREALPPDVLDAPRLIPPKTPSPDADPAMRSLTGRLSLAFPIEGTDGAARAVLLILMNEEYPKNQFRNLVDIAVVDGNDSPYVNLTVKDDAELARLTAEYRRGGTPPSGVLVAESQRYEDVTVVYVPNTEALTRQLLGIFGLVAGFALAAVGSAVAVGGRLSRLITRPLNELAERLAAYPGGEPAPDGVLPEPAKPRMSLRENILYCFLIVVLPTCIAFSVFTVLFFSHITAGQERASHEALFLQSKSNLQALLSNVEAVSKSIALGKSVQEGVRAPAGGLLSRPDDMDMYLADVDLSLFDREGRLVLVTNTGPGYSAVLPPSQRDSISGWRVEYGAGRADFIYQMPIRDLETLEVHGYLLCRLPELAVSQEYQDMVRGGSRVFLFSGDGRIVSHPYRSLIGSDAGKDSLLAGANRESGFCFVSRIKDTPYYLAAEYDTQVLQSERRSYFLSACYLLIAILLAVVLISILLARFYSRHFHRLSTRLLSIGDGDITEEECLIDEVSRMNAAFGDMTRRIRLLLEDSLQAAESRHRLEMDKRRVEVALLQAQINPHFLHNTFGCINYMIKKGRQEEAVYIINSLSEMLRFATRENRELVPLRDELRYAKAYLTIMELRYGDILTATFSVDEALNECPVPRLILQPLLENAITHGIVPSGVPGVVSVSVFMSEERLYIVVRDSGVGFETERLEPLLRENGADTGKKSIGVHNIQNRIRFSYGAPYGLYYHSKPGEGTTATIILPRA